MASRATHRGTLPPMPAEILQQICKNLDQPDLKRFRLACKSFSYAAEASLFRRVLLKRNVESFMKLRMITGHPRISKLVKALCYSGMVISGAYRCKDFEEWHDSMTWQGPYRSCRTRAICEFSKSLTSEELHVHYEKLCAHRHSEELMEKYDIETQDLTSAFAKLPQLEEICFASDDNCDTLSDRMSFDQMSSIARATLVEPQWHGGYSFRAGQLTALLKAAHTVQKPLKKIKALGMPWSVFQQSKEVSSMMASATKSCQYLAIEMDFDDDQDNGRANLARMVSSSPSLHTLEISFGRLPFEGREWIVRLSELFEAGAHWPNLKRLKLQALRATDISLRTLLTAHAATLRSLELAHMDLERYQLDGKRCHGSWVETILFLQSSLSLETVRLGGNLSNRWDEAWGIHDPDESDHWLRWGDGIPEEGSCLKHRIEQFVVEGGACPLPMPHDAKESGGWECVLGFCVDRSWDLLPRI